MSVTTMRMKLKWVYVATSFLSINTGERDISDHHWTAENYSWSPFCCTESWLGDLVAWLFHKRQEEQLAGEVYQHCLWFMRVFCC